MIVFIGIFYILLAMIDIFGTSPGILIGLSHPLKLVY